MRKKEITIFIVLILSLLQAFFLSHDDMQENINEFECIREEKAVKNIKDIESELSLIENLEVVSYNKKEGKWIGRLIIEGTNNEVINSFNKLEGYNINNYSIKYNKEKLTLELEIENMWYHINEVNINNCFY